MTHVSRFRVTSILCTVLIAWGAQAEEDFVPLSSDAVKDRWHNRLNSQHFVARMRMKMNLAGLKEEREMVVFRDDDGGSRERVLVRFEKPADLRKGAILYIENPGRSNDYFLYQPSIRRVRRLPASIADDDVYGIDLEFLGFGVAQSTATKIDSMKKERINDRDTYRLEETAIQRNPRFDRRITWVDAEHFVPLKTEHFMNDKLVLLAETKRVETINGIATPREMYFQRTRSGEEREVSLIIDEVDYQKDIPEDVFSVFNLTRRQRPGN